MREIKTPFAIPDLGPAPSAQGQPSQRDRWPSKRQPKDIVKEILNFLKSGKRNKYGPIIMAREMNLSIRKMREYLEIIRTFQMESEAESLRLNYSSGYYLGPKQEVRPEIEPEIGGKQFKFIDLWAGEEFPEDSPDYLDEIRGIVWNEEKPILYRLVLYGLVYPQEALNNWSSIELREAPRELLKAVGEKNFVDNG